MRFGRRAVLRLVVGLAAFGAAGWVVFSRPEHLTPETAKQAIAAWVRSTESDSFRGVKTWLADHGDEQVKVGTDDVRWGPFTIDVTKREYSFALEFGPPQRFCLWSYRGAFAMEGRRWRALTPDVVSQALGAR